MVPNKGDEDCAALRAFELGASEGVELGEVLGFHRWLARAPFPAPPWYGTPTIRPLRSAAEMKQAAQAFNNCLSEQIQSVLAGQRYYYLSMQPHEAVCELVMDPYGGWALGDVRGKRNARLPDAAASIIAAAFGAAGYRKLPRPGLLPSQLEPFEWVVAGI